MIVTITSFSATAFADPIILLDKSTYKYGDIVKVSGNVEYQQEMFVIIQIRSTTDIVAIDQMLPSRSGKFSATFDTEGSKWKESGTYTVLASYAGQKVEKSFQFSKPVEKPLEEEKTEPKPQMLEMPKPKIVIKGFPDPANSPQYYYDRYANEIEFKHWFDSMFVGYTIQEAVGYKPTHVPEFPDPSHSPQYYINRYNSEDLFRAWFDRQFSEKTIYDIVGMTEPTRTIAPKWVKQYAQMWSDDEIDDKRFIDGIADLIRQNIIAVNGDIIPQNGHDKIIPSWFKNTARWYGQDLITDDDFLSGLQYLIEKEIIVV
ncbi:hypothetical protein DSQ19_07140 [Candidatus Nitrosotenuis sp. DW1]|nr:hypothetical protein DSQ19_07140 [Candidatus Nitrosotenuis sp. DW1]